MTAFVSLPLLTKSARLNRLRLVLVASVSSIVVIDATFLIQIVSASGAIIIPISVFAFTFLPMFLVLLEMMSGGNQGIAVFRSVGARKRTIAASILVTIVGAGLIGALGGEAVGLLLAGAYAAVSPVAALDSAAAVPPIQGATYVLASFAAGLIGGVIAGVRFTWDKLN